MPEPASDVFVSYKREDRTRVAPLVERLRAAGLTVWWDADIPGGASWRPELIRHLDAAKCVVVVWTERSVSNGADFVIEEAERARQRGVLVPIRLDPVQPPIGFGQIQTLDLSEWPRNRDAAGFGELVGAVQAIAKGTPRSHRPIPILRRRRNLAGSAATAAVIIGIGIALDLAGVRSAICTVPGVNAACGELGVAGVPSRSERAAWLARPVGDCEWLRTLVSRRPDGPYASEALKRLQAARTVREATWHPETHRLQLFVRMGLQSLPSRTAAEADALARGDAEAQQLCARYDGELFRHRSATIDDKALAWQCETRNGGVRCSLETQVLCEVESRRTVAREVCE